MHQLVEDVVGVAGPEPVDLGVVVEFGIHDDATELGSIGGDGTSTLAKLREPRDCRLGTMRIIKHGREAGLELIPRLQDLILLLQERSDPIERRASEQGRDETGLGSVAGKSFGGDGKMQLYRINKLAKLKTF